VLLPKSTAVVSPACVYLSAQYLCGKNDAARITKLCAQIFHDESWKSVYFEIKRSKISSRKNGAGVSRCTLVSAGFFYLLPSTHCNG